jgi:hypothetical protein
MSKRKAVNPVRLQVALALLTTAGALAAIVSSAMDRSGMWWSTCVWAGIAAAWSWIAVPKESMVQTYKRLANERVYGSTAERGQF